METLNQQEKIYYKGNVCSHIIWDSLNPLTQTIKITVKGSDLIILISLSELYN